MKPFVTYSLKFVNFQGISFKNTLIHPFILLCLFWIQLHAELKYPVEVSFLVSDLKYNPKEGIKICEVQHGALLAIDGDLYISENDGKISPMIAEIFNRFSTNRWATGLLYPPLKLMLGVNQWNVISSIQILLNDPNFVKTASLSPLTHSAIESYKGMVYADFNIASNYHYYRIRYSVFFNAATFPF
jgi:hypothetical protein